jgi:hypothetical protein
MNILKQLAKEHKEVKAIFKKLDKTSEKSSKLRATLFKELDLGLSVHAEIEEAVLYERIKEDSKTKKDEDQILEAFEEHHVAKWLLFELRNLAPSDEKWGAKLTVLNEMIDHHVEEEESDCWKIARKLFSAEQLDEMGDEYLEQKQIWIDSHSNDGHSIKRKANVKPMELHW